MIECSPSNTFTFGELVACCLWSFSLGWTVLAYLHRKHIKKYMDRVCELSGVDSP